MTMSNTVVHWEIGGRNLSVLRDFYAKAFNWTIAGLGGAMTVPPTRINESLSFAMFQDPSGNTVGLLQGEPLDRR
jgi:predicted enzyme related to lactoylglutathione lyase